MNNRDRDVLDKIIRYCDDIAHLMNEYNYDYRETDVMSKRCPEQPVRDTFL